MFNWEKYLLKSNVILLTTWKYKEKYCLLQWMIDTMSSSFVFGKYFLQALKLIADNKTNICTIARTEELQKISSTKDDQVYFI